MIIKNKWATYVGYGFAGLFGVWAQKWTEPDAPSAAAIHAAVTLGNGVTTTVSTLITNPDFPRVISITGAMAGGSLTGNVVITGTNIRGKVITDTIALNNNATVDGVKAFKTVTSILLPARVTSGDTVSIGISDKLGLEVIPAYAVAVTAHHNGVLEGTLPTITRDDDEICKNVVDFNSACGADHDQVIVFYTAEKPNKLSRTV
jgi:hypothetical protein